MDTKTVQKVASTAHEYERIKGWRDTINKLKGEKVRVTIRTSDQEAHFDLSPQQFVTVLEDEMRSLASKLIKHGVEV